MEFFGAALLLTTDSELAKVKDVEVRYVRP
jgi:hypothetical protein